MTNEHTALIYDHYKDTCSIIGAAIKRRDRLMAFVIITLGFFTFSAFFPSSSSQAIGQFLNFKFGLSLQINLHIIGSIIWFFLLVFTIRYFQTAVFIERQYKYLHQIENNLNLQFGKDLILREGKAYLSGYPLFSNWMWLLYTIVFPLLLFLVTAAKITNEWFYNPKSLGLILNSFLFLLLTISIFLYFHLLHFSKKVVGGGAK